MNKKKTIITAAIILLIVAVMLVGGIFAYFTSTPAALTNTFTIGNVTITLTEPTWVAANGQNLTPGDNVLKDPTITNTGANEAYVFMKVEMPYYNSEDLFTMNTIDIAAWNLVSETTSGAVHTYVYAYADGTGVDDLVALDPTDTATLFTSVTMSTDNTTVEAASGNTLNIVVTGYAIQTNIDTTSLTTQAAVYGQFTN